MGALTRIKIVVNFTEETVFVKNFETGLEETIAPTYAEAVDIVVPWCESSSEYPTRKLSVKPQKTGGGGSAVAWLWESSSVVYINTVDSFSKTAEKAVDCCYWTLMIVKYANAGKTEYEVKLSQIR